MSAGMTNRRHESESSFRLGTLPYAPYQGGPRAVQISSVTLHAMLDDLSSLRQRVSHLELECANQSTKLETVEKRLEELSAHLLLSVQKSSLDCAGETVVHKTPPPLSGNVAASTVVHGDNTSTSLATSSKGATPFGDCAPIVDVTLWPVRDSLRTTCGRTCALAPLCLRRGVAEKTCLMDWVTQNHCRYQSYFAFETSTSVPGLQIACCAELEWRGELGPYKVADIQFGTSKKKAERKAVIQIIHEVFGVPLSEFKQTLLLP